MRYCTLSLGPVLGHLLHQRARQSAPRRLDAFDSRRKLAVVARQHHAVGSRHGHPARCFERLGRLVDEKGVEALAREQRVGCAGQRAGHDARRVEKLLTDAQLQFGGAVAQSSDFLVERLAAPAAGCGVQLADGAAYGPKLRIVGVGLEAPLVGEGEHLVVDARRVADAQYRDAPVDEFFGNPVDRHVALRAYQYLTLAPQYLIDGLDQGGGFPRAGRAVDHGDVVRAEHLADGQFLGAVEPWQADRLGRPFPGRQRPVDDVAQVGGAVVACGDDRVEGGEHEAVRRLVETQLHAQPLGPFEGGQCCRIGQFDHHAVGFGVTDRGREGQVREPARGVLFEEA